MKDKLLFPFLSIVLFGNIIFSLSMGIGALIHLVNILVCAYALFRGVLRIRSGKDKQEMGYWLIVCFGVSLCVSLYYIYYLIAYSSI